MKKFLLVIYIICVHTACTQASTDTLYAFRLANLKGEMQLLYSPEVKPFIHTFITNKNTTSVMLGNWASDTTFRDSIFKVYSIPAEIQTLAMGMSNYKYDVQLANGNAGYWLIPYQVAKAYGLKINSYVDERRDVKLATKVFAQSLADYYFIYKDWKLALAAYASSPAAVNKSIRMANSSIHYDSIRKFLSSEAQQIINQLTASVYIKNFHQEHGIYMQHIKPIPLAKTMVYQWMNLDDIASTLLLNKEDFAKMNPIYKKRIIPKNVLGYELIYPSSLKDSLYKIFVLDYQPYPNEDIRGEAPELEFKNIPVKKFTDTAELDSSQKALLKTNQNLKPKEVNTTPKNTNTKNYKIYIVKKGQSLGIIANQNHVSVSDLRKWNNIHGNTIYPGQKLKIYK